MSWSSTANSFVYSGDLVPFGTGPAATVASGATAFPSEGAASPNPNATGAGETATPMETITVPPPS